MKPPTNLGAFYYRQFLSKQGQGVYDRLHAQLQRADFSGQVPVAISQPETAASDSFAAFKALREDHPEYFFLGIRLHFFSSRLGQEGLLQYPILYSASQIRQIRRELRKTIFQMVRGTALLSEQEREALTYERIARRLSYLDRQDPSDHTVVGPVLFSSGVCEGYNALLLLCLRRLKIPCIKASGYTATQTAHCWTIAWLQGNPVHCDVTWDTGRDRRSGFRYFNVSDAQLATDHFNFQTEKLPRCLTEQYNPYPIP